MYRWLEFCLALLMLVVAAPVMLIVALLIYWQMGRPILFKQQRPGWYARPFYIYKFRTMHLTTRPDHETLGDTSRLTKFGDWLRRLSLDELPQLFNILRGDVGFVGPRPLLMEHLKLYTPEQMRRHLVRPGVTGWAQVNGRNSLEWDKKLELDVWYVDNKSFWLDLKILFMTAVVVFSGRDTDYKAHTLGFKNDSTKA